MSNRTWKTLVVMNPNSSNGRTGRLWPSLEPSLRGVIGVYDLAVTSRTKEATDLTRNALSHGYERIVSVGGDGTHHEVINGFFDGETALAPTALLSVITSGTGGDFRKTFGVPPGPEAAIERLGNATVRPIDVGRFWYTDARGERRIGHFLNILSFGIGGLVDHTVNTTTKMLGGKASFFLGTLRAFMKYRPQTVKIRVDGGPWRETTIHNIAVANGQFFGGGMNVAPEAQPDDGLFDIVGFEHMTTTGFLAMAKQIYRGSHIGNQGVTHTRATVLEAESTEDVLLDVDGEQEGRLPIRIQLIPCCLNLLI